MKRKAIAVISILIFAIILVSKNPCMIYSQETEAGMKEAPVSAKDVKEILACMKGKVSESDVLAHYKENRDITTLNPIDLISYYTCRATEAKKPAPCSKLGAADEEIQCKMNYLMYEKVFPLIKSKQPVDEAIDSVLNELAGGSGPSPSAADIEITKNLYNSVSKRDEKGCEKLPENEKVICKATIKNDVSICKTIPPESDHKRELEQVCEENVIAMNAYIKGDKSRLKVLPLVDFFVAVAIPVRYHFNKDFCNEYFYKVLKTDYCVSKYEPKIQRIETDPGGNIRIDHEGNITDLDGNIIEQ